MRQVERWRGRPVRERSIDRGTGVRGGGEDREDERKQEQDGGRAGRRLAPLDSLDGGGRRRATGAVVVFARDRGRTGGRFTRSHGGIVIPNSVAVGTAFRLVRGRRGNSSRGVRGRRRAARVAGFARAKAGRQEHRHAGQQRQDSPQDRQRHLREYRLAVSAVYRPRPSRSSSPKPLLHRLIDRDQCPPPGSQRREASEY